MAAKIGDLVFLNEHDFATICPTLLKICPNLSHSSGRKNGSEMELGKHILAPLSCMKRSIREESSMDWDKSISHLTSMLASRQRGKEKKHELIYLQTAISACQYET